MIIKLIPVKTHRDSDDALLALIESFKALSNSASSQVKSALNSAYGQRSTSDATTKSARAQMDEAYRLRIKGQRVTNDSSLVAILDKMADMSAEVCKASNYRVTQGAYIIEECAELTKELVKVARGKGDDAAVREEAIDVLAAISVLLHQLGLDRKTVESHMLHKYVRALNRWNANKEL